jgi:hypothetical protein
MSDRRHYTKKELLADSEYASRLRHEGILFHGGLDASGSYVPPRSRHRLDAIRAWTAHLARAGHSTRVIDPQAVERVFFPTVEQSKTLLRHGARGAMTRMLTLIGITEGFGNDGIRSLPVLDVQRYFKEPIDGTCLSHLHQGMLEAHGNDEAGCGNEAGHDAMWYAIRDAALDHPAITADMYENLPIAPPPGYSGPAKPSPEAIGVGRMSQQFFPTLDFLFEVTLKAMAQILVIELMAYSTFAWAQEVLSDPSCSAEPDLPARLVGYIQEDENIHVAYLQCALAEARARTMLATDGSTIEGRGVIDAICNNAIADHTGSRFDRLMSFRMGQIRAELAGRPDGDTIITHLAATGPIPDQPGMQAAAAR